MINDLSDFQPPARYGLKFVSWTDVKALLEEEVKDRKELNAAARARGEAVAAVFLKLMGNALPTSAAEEEIIFVVVEDVSDRSVVLVTASGMSRHSIGSRSEMTEFRVPAILVRCGGRELNADLDVIDELIIERRSDAVEHDVNSEVSKRESISMHRRGNIRKAKAPAYPRTSSSLGKADLLGSEEKASEKNRSR